MVFQEFAVSVQKNQNYSICWYKLLIVPLNLVKRIITVKQKGKPMGKKKPYWSMLSALFHLQNRLQEEEGLTGEILISQWLF